MLAAEELADRPVPLAQLVGVVGVVDRQHRDAVPDGAELVDRRPADPLGRAVGGDQLGVFGLDLLQFFEEPVELPVGDFRNGVHVVLVVVVVDLLPELRGTFFRGHEESGVRSQESGPDTAQGPAPLRRIVYGPRVDNKASSRRRVRGLPDP